MKFILLFATGLLLSTQWASAELIRFTNSWKTLDFFTIPATRYEMKGSFVDIVAEQSSSVVYNPLPKKNWKSIRAFWSWETMQSVPPTDLSKKGGDDRNISLYFVYLDQITAMRIGRTASIKKLLTSRNSRIVVYTFGGDQPRNTMQKNPYFGRRGVTIIKRPARPGAFDEGVDLVADYRKAFGSVPEALVGVALASDSDNTGSVVIARVKNLRIE